MYLSGELENASMKPFWVAKDLTEQKIASPRVLVVDDQKLIADTLAEILSESGFEAIAVYDAHQALEIASSFHPNWLVSDILMPHMHGVALAIEIREKHPATLILLFSGQAGISEILQEGQQKGYEFEVLPKPIHPLTLINRLKQQT
jgi:CheY-like chemotaxis protein